MKKIVKMFQKGSVYAIASRCGIGKTQVCLKFADYAVGNKEKTLYLSDQIDGKEFDNLISRMNLSGENSVVCKRAFYLQKSKLKSLLNEDEYDYLILDPFDIYVYDIDMGDLKELAIENDIAIIVTKNLSRPPFFSRRKHPVMSDLKFADKKIKAKFIAYTDIILFLEKKPSENFMSFIVAKNIKGTIGYKLVANINE